MITSFFEKEIKQKKIISTKETENRYRE